MLVFQDLISHHNLELKQIGILKKIKISIVREDLPLIHHHHLHILVPHLLIVLVDQVIEIVDTSIQKEGVPNYRKIDKDQDKDKDKEDIKIDQTITDIKIKDLTLKTQNLFSNILNIIIQITIKDTNKNNIKRLHIQNLIIKNFIKNLHHQNINQIIIQDNSLIKNLTTIITLKDSKQIKNHILFLLIVNTKKTFQNPLTINKLKISNRKNL